MISTHRYEAVIIWTSGEVTRHSTNRRDKARQVIDNYKLAFGSQIAYAYINERG